MHQTCHILHLFIRTELCCKPSPSRYITYPIFSFGWDIC